MLDPIADKMMPMIMQNVFNAVTVDDFIQYDAKHGRFLIGDGNGGVRPLSPQESAEYIQSAKECANNWFFQSFQKQLRYKGQETMALSKDWDAVVFPKGILYAADLSERLVAVVKNLQVANKNESPNERKKGVKGRGEGK